MELKKNFLLVWITQVKMRPNFSSYDSNLKSKERSLFHKILAMLQNHSQRLGIGPQYFTVITKGRERVVTI